MNYLLTEKFCKERGHYTTSKDTCTQKKRKCGKINFLFPLRILLVPNIDIERRFDIFHLVIVGNG